MSIRKMALSVLVPMLLASATAYAAGPQPQSALFAQYSVAAVKPYVVQESTGYDSYPVLRGAQVYIRAQEGLTAEWLNYSLQKALAQHTASGPAVKKLNVNVISAGAGFWVIFSSDDVRSADTILSWARSVAAEHHAQSLASAK